MANQSEETQQGTDAANDDDSEFSYEDVDPAVPEWSNDIPFKSAWRHGLMKTAYKYIFRRLRLESVSKLFQLRPRHPPFNRTILLGTGQAFAVYKASSMSAADDFREMAVKLPASDDLSDFTRKVVKHEIDVYKKLGTGNANIAVCYGARLNGLHWPRRQNDRTALEGLQGEKAYVVLEYMPTTLDTLMHEDVHFGTSCTYGKLLRIFIDVARGLQQLHEKDVRHANLKLSNIRIDESGTAKLSDFRPFDGDGVRERMRMDISEFGELLVKCVTCNNPDQAEEGGTLGEFKDFNENYCKWSSIDASRIARLLESMLEKTWVDDFPPWVEENRKRRYVMNHEGSHCSIDVHKLLGIGALGQVFKGLYKDNDGELHDVAIKLTTLLEWDRAQKALKTELQVFDKLGTGHPNVVRCFGGNVSDVEWQTSNMDNIDIDDHANFLVLEYHSRDLHHLLYSDQEFNTTCTYRRLIELFMDMAKGLQFLHEMAIVHYDLKPANVLIDAQGRAKLTDFGESKIRMRYSITNSLRGTLGYMAPELTQFWDDARTVRVTDSIDVHSLGVMMTECLVQAGPLSAGYHYGEQPEELWRLIFKCCLDFEVEDSNCAKRPTPAEVVDELQAMLTLPWVNDFLPWVRRG